MVSVSILTSTSVKAQEDPHEEDTFQVLQQAIAACDENNEKTLIIRPYDTIGKFYVRTTVICNNNKFISTRFLDPKKNPMFSQAILGLRPNQLGKKISFSAEGVDVKVNYLPR